MTTPVTAKLAVRLSDHEREAVTVIMQSMAVPNREPPTVSEAVRVAIHRHAEHLSRHRGA